MGSEYPHIQHGLHTGHGLAESGTAFRGITRTCIKGHSINSTSLR